MRDRSRAGAYTVMLMLGAGMLAMFYLLTLYMQIVRRYSPIHTGFAYLPFVVGLGIAVGGIGPKLYDKLPARAVIGAGLLIYGGGLAWCVATLSPTSDYFVAILPTLAVGGFGAGLVFLGATAVAVHGVAPGQSGSAASCRTPECRWEPRSASPRSPPPPRSSPSITSLATRLRLL